MAATATRRPMIVHLERVTPMSWAGGEAARFLLRGADTGGLFSFYEVIVPPGEGSLFHIHRDMDETFYVVSGEFEINLGGDRHRVPAGTLAYGPRGIGHSFVNRSDRPGTMLCTTTPGGIEDFFEALGLLLKSRPRPGWEQMRDLAARHGIESFPPDGASADAAVHHLDRPDAAVHHLDRPDAAVPPTRQKGDRTRE